MQVDPYHIQVIHETAHRLEGNADDYDALMSLIGEASVVLLGESTHGSHEFYRERARITKRLIRERGFAAVAVEGDWPDSYRVHRFITGSAAGGGDAEAALAGFMRFPSWMWANADILDFVGWLRDWNEEHGPASHPVGFYGLDLYSLYTSIAEVVRYLEAVDPAAARLARKRYACFDQFRGDSLRYAYATAAGLTGACEEEAVLQTVEVLRRSSRFPPSSSDAHEDLFDAEQNSRVVQNAEHYYRTMLRADVSSWNLRDQHMMETLERVLQHLADRGHPPKVVVWAHNSHVGDARATAMGRRGELNLGQLVRERLKDASRSIGFTTHAGTVTAAHDWDGPAERMRLKPALEGSYEALFHAAIPAPFLVSLREGYALRELLGAPRLERAVGVVYRPDTERLSHYFEATLTQQFDAVIHIDHTRSVEPLERRSRWQPEAEAPETYPSGT
jgi:erythromycin esterase-like protein